MVDTVPGLVQAARSAARLGAVSATPPVRFRKSRREKPEEGLRRSRGCVANLIASSQSSLAARSANIEPPFRLVTYDPPVRNPVSSDPPSPRVAVVGAGFAGLSAAFRLQGWGIPSVVLEARDRVGGRVLTARLDNGEPAELGAEWIEEHERAVQSLMASEQPTEETALRATGE